MNRRSIGAACAATLIALIAIAPGAQAEDGLASEEYGGAASGRALDLSLHGHRVTFGAGGAGGDLDGVAGQVVAAATGVGSQLAEGTMVAAAMGEAKEECATAALSDVLGPLDLAADLVCGSAEVTGSGTDLVARGSGRIGSLTLSTESLLSTLFDDPALAAILDEALGTVRDIADQVEQGIDENVDPLVKQAVGVLNEQLSALTGDDLLPVLDLSDTVGSLVDRIKNADLVDVRLGEATGAVEAGARTLSARAEDEGAVVDVLPGVWADGRALATVTVAGSTAEVSYDREQAAVSAGSSSSVVTVTSPLLPTPISVGEGERVSVFCDGDSLPLVDALPLDVGVLCTEIAVSSPTQEKVGDRLRASASLVTVHVAKGLDRLVPMSTLNLPALPALPALPLELPFVGGVVTTAATPGGGVPGIRLELAGATAEAGGGKVLGEVKVEDPDEPFQGPLPRTGVAGLPFAAAALVGAATGLRAILRRRGA